MPFMPGSCSLTFSVSVPCTSVGEGLDNRHMPVRSGCLEKGLVVNPPGSKLMGRTGVATARAGNLRNKLLNKGGSLLAHGSLVAGVCSHAMHLPTHNGLDHI